MKQFLKVHFKIRFCNIKIIQKMQNGWWFIREKKAGGNEFTNLPIFKSLSKIIMPGAWFFFKKNQPSSKLLMILVEVTIHSLKICAIEDWTPVAFDNRFLILVSQDAQSFWTSCISLNLLTLVINWHFMTYANKILAICCTLCWWGGALKMEQTTK